MIDAEDIPKTDPLRIKIEGKMVYDYEVIYATQKANNFAVEWRGSENSTYLNFDYLDYGQGVIIKIIHAGNGVSYKSNISSLKGSIKRATRVENPHPSFAPTNFLVDSKLFYEDSIFI